MLTAWTPTAASLERRQIWWTPTTFVHPPHCTAFEFPANGILIFNSASTVTLTQTAIYQPPCGTLNVLDANRTLLINDFDDPFVSSTIPQVFVIGATLVIACTLLMILVITPRTALATGGLGNLMNMTEGGSSAMSSGGRPLLQKAAALTVVVSLLLAAVNSFRVAYDQYEAGYEDAEALTIEVVGSLELRIIRVISDTFLWLAQVQTLIRLFPRQKEKAIIKWTGFALILLDTIFSMLDNFMVQGDMQLIRRPQNFNSSISVLSYLFQLAFSVIYMASVIYYSIVKRRFAYYHRRMRNISVVALLSLISVAIPVVFFVVDIANYAVIGWSDYVRWVGAAAGSVVVWEWVERVEVLERKERKDGILGREIFEDDDVIASHKWSGPGWPKRYRRGNKNGGSWRGGGSGSGTGSGFLHHVDAVKRPPRAAQRGLPPQPAPQPRETGTANDLIAAVPQPREPPPTVASPVSRSDSTSAASTVYAVIYHPVPESAAPATEPGLTLIGSGELHQDSTLDPLSQRSQSQRTEPSNRPTPPGSQAQPHTNGSTHPQPPVEGPLRSRLPRPFQRIGTAFAQRSSPVASAHAPPVRSKSGSLRQFRLRRSAPKPMVELPLYVIRGGNNGDELVVERQSSHSHHYVPILSGGDSSTPPTPNHVVAPGSNHPRGSASPRRE
jgi:PalH/RIM21